MKKYLIGGGGLAKEIILSFKNEEKFDGIWDDNLTKGVVFSGLNIMGSIDEIKYYENELYYIAIGNAILREKLYNSLISKNIQFGTLIHSSVKLFDLETINIGKGTIIMPFAYLTMNINIDNNCIIHISSGIHHDANIGAHSLLMPGAKITCGATLGKCSKMKSNSVITENKKYNDYEIF